MHKRLMLAASAALLVVSTTALAGGGLKVGEYACSESARQAPLMALAFKVLDGSHYTDLEGKNAGTFQVSGGKVYFHGGHLDGQVGEGLTGASAFTFDSGEVSCGPW